MTKLFAALFVLFSSFIIQAPAHAIGLSSSASPSNLRYETRSLGGSLTVQPGQTQSLELALPRYIKNIVVQANGIRQDSTVEVMVNGQVKGTIRAPGEDPSYVVTIAETAKSIEFRHRDGGTMQITQVIGTVSTWAGPARSPVGGGMGVSNEQMVRLAQETISLVDALKAFARYNEDAVYLFPIKKNASMVYVMASAHGELAGKSIEQLRSLGYQIDFAKEYLEGLMQNEEAFDLVTELLTIRETIIQLLQ